MIRIRKVLLLGLIIVVIFLIFVAYSIITLTKSENEVISVLTVEEKILLKVAVLPDYYKTKQTSVDNLTNIFISSLTLNSNIRDLIPLWNEANAAVSKTQLYDLKSRNFGSIFNAIKVAKVVKADLDVRGTQLKFLLTLEGHQEVVFKPKWYNQDKIIIGPVYSGKDRYNSEILAFYLSAILHRPLAPISVARTVHVKKELLSVATQRLLLTAFERQNKSCIFGQCLYCIRTDPICENAQGNLEGVVIFNIHKSLKSHRSPWQRTYKKNKLAAWQKNNNYCRSLTGKISKNRLYDLIETSIFDFLIQNGDRHHYETLDDRVVLIDNGKGLGNPYMNHIDILAPLYQCCILRETMWNRLKELSGGLLHEILKSIPNIEIIPDAHLNALTERLLIVFATVEYCRDKHNVHDIF